VRAARGRGAASGPGPLAARRAFGTLVLSASPGGIVLDWPADGSPILLHELGSGPPALDEAVTR